MKTYSRHTPDDFKASRMSSPSMTSNDFAVYCKSLDAWITNGVPESTALLVAAAPKLLDQLESLLAALTAYKPGDGEAFAVLCREFTDARRVIAEAKPEVPPDNHPRIPDTRRRGRSASTRRPG